MDCLIIIMDCLINIFVWENHHKYITSALNSIFPSERYYSLPPYIVDERKVIWEIDVDRFTVSINLLKMILFIEYI